MAGPVTLYVDGDVEAYKAAAFNQINVTWEPPDGVTTVLKVEEAFNQLDRVLAGYKETLDADRIVVCLSDKENFRKELCPTYKANRKDVARPVLLEQCRAYLRERYRVACWPRLEADDVMGILASGDDNGIVVSIDKDMATVPGLWFNPNRPDDGVVFTGESHAFINHMRQTLTGDSTDGYPGCPGIGPKKAYALLTDALYQHPINTCQWKGHLWEAVKQAFIARSLTERDALLQARLACILTAGMYRSSGKIRLWTPPALDP